MVKYCRRVSPVKSLLQHKVWIAGDTVRLLLSEDDLKPETEEVLFDADKKINEWFEG